MLKYSKKKEKSFKMYDCVIVFAIRKNKKKKKRYNLKI